jgi:medium-chain acyl-[acyl-carrier-protein] hydrolase
VDRRWLVGRELNPDAELRLFCLPYAGGGAAVYREWADLIPGDIQLCPLELPGRGSRMGEEPFVRLTPLVNALVDAFQTAFDRPFAFFGHSMGGLIAFELARALHERGDPVPVHLFISGKAAPGVPSPLTDVHSAADGDVMRRLRKLGGTPQVLLENAELMELMLPTLKADFSVIETYEHRVRTPLPIPMTVFGGVDDEVVPPPALEGWREHSSEGCRLRLFPGDHFFPHSATADITAAITQVLASRSATRASA